jgi:hypothetical protein
MRSIPINRFLDKFSRQNLPPRRACHLSDLASQPWLISLYPHSTQRVDPALGLAAGGGDSPADLRSVSHTA